MPQRLDASPPANSADLVMNPQQNIWESVAPQALGLMQRSEVEGGGRREEGRERDRWGKELNPLHSRVS